MLRGWIEGIIKELKKLQKAPTPYRDKDDDFPLPRTIAAGNGGSIIISRVIDEAIATVADQLLDADATLKPKYTRHEWRSLVRRAFGPALAAIDLDDDLAKSANTVLAKIKEALAGQESCYGNCEFAFGCTLFGNAAVEPFAIGPVRFEPRLDWLVRKSGEGAVSAVTRGRVERAWSGNRLRKRKLSSDSNCETNILHALGDCAVVCSITTNGLADEAGRDKALTAARVATAAIALTWQIPSKALNGMNLLFDRRPHVQTTLTFIPDTIMLAGWRRSHHPTGPLLKTGEWEKIFSEQSDYFAVVGDVLDFMVSPTGVVARPNMMKTLAQAMLWFHEACRETVSLGAIIKYSAALDALACGDRARGIRRLINTRLGIQDNAPIRQDGPTLTQAIGEIYGYGRSRTIHGNNEKLAHDWMGTRDLAEQFTRLCLLACIDWAASNPRSDDPSQLSR